MDLLKKYWVISVNPNNSPKRWMRRLRKSGVQGGVSPVISDEGYDIQNIVLFCNEEKADKIFFSFSNDVRNLCMKNITEDEAYDYLSTLHDGRYCFMASEVTWLNNFSMPKTFVWFDNKVTPVEDKAFTAQQLLDVYKRWEDEATSSKYADYDSITKVGIGMLNFLEYAKVINKEQGDKLFNNLIAKANAAETEKIQQDYLKWERNDYEYISEEKRKAGMNRGE